MRLFFFWLPLILCPSGCALIRIGPAAEINRDTWISP